MFSTKVNKKYNMCKQLQLKSCFFLENEVPITKIPHQLYAKKTVAASPCKEPAAFLMKNYENEE